MMEEASQLSLVEKTNRIFEMLQFDVKQCKVMSVEELKITAPVVVVKIFERIVGLSLDNHIKQDAFESNADVVLKTLQSRFGLNSRITPSLLLRGDLSVLEQIMTVMYDMAMKKVNINLTSTSSSLFTKEEKQTHNRVLNISSRFGFTMNSTHRSEAEFSYVSSGKVDGSLPRTQSLSSPENIWISSRDRADMERLAAQEEKKQKKEEKILRLSQLPKKHDRHEKSQNIDSNTDNANTSGDEGRKKTNSEDDSSETSADSCIWHGWQDEGRRNLHVTSTLRRSKSRVQEKPKEIYCYDTYSGYRVHPKLHAILIKKNNPELSKQDETPESFQLLKEETRLARSASSLSFPKSPIDNRRSRLAKSQSTGNTEPALTINASSNELAKSATAREKIHLDRTVYTATARPLKCYKNLERLDLIISIEHSFREQGGKSFTKEKDIENSKHHSTVADHIFRHVVKVTHQEFKPHVRLRLIRINSQLRKKKEDVTNEKYSKYLEVQIAYRDHSGDVYPNLLFSKSKCGQWPSIKVLDKRLRAFYARMDMQLHSLVDPNDEAPLEKYPEIQSGYIEASKELKTPDIIDIFDARKLYSDETENDWETQSS